MTTLAAGEHLSSQLCLLCFCQVLLYSGPFVVVLAFTAECLSFVKDFLAIPFVSPTHNNFCSDISITQYRNFCMIAIIWKLNLEFLIWAYTEIREHRGSFLLFECDCLVISIQVGRLVNDVCILDLKFEHIKLRILATLK